MAQWIRPQTLNLEVPGLHLLAAAVVLLGKALYSHCLVPRKGLKYVSPLVACFNRAACQKGINAVQRCSVENQKGTFTTYQVCGHSALLVLNGTLLIAEQH